MTLVDGREIEARHTYVVDGRDTTCLVAGCSHHGACVRGFMSTTTFLHSLEAEPYDAAERALATVTGRAWRESEYYADVTRAAVAALGVAAPWAATEARARDDRAALAFLDGRLAVDDADALFVAGPARDWWCRVTEVLNRASVTALRATWAGASEAGTRLHELLEHYCNAHAISETAVAAHRRRILALEEIELSAVLTWFETHVRGNGWRPFRVEPRVVDDTLRMCGSIDLLIEHDEHEALIDLDWKRARAVTRNGRVRVPLGADERPAADELAATHAHFHAALAFRWARPERPWRLRHFVAPLADVVADNYRVYAMQQQFYVHMLRRPVSHMGLIVTHPRQAGRVDLISLAFEPALLERFKAARACQLSASKASRSATRAADTSSP